MSAESSTGSEAREQLASRVEHIEAGYELMLAYAAQGLPTDQGATHGAQLREYLQRFDSALTGLADLYRTVISLEARAPIATYEAFLDVLSRDATAAQAGLRIVMAQSNISSQLIDNLNASIHVRALLTDVFLIDELLKQ
jgi:hypothetical protein